MCNSDFWVALVICFEVAMIIGIFIELTRRWCNASEGTDSNDIFRSLYQYTGTDFDDS